MARRSDHSREEIKEMALSAAEQIVTEKSYASLTARKVSAAIGYTVGSLYLVFKNLDDLCLQLNGRTLDMLSQSLDEVFASDQAPDQALRSLGRTYLQFALDNRYRWGMVFEHMLPEDATVPEWYTEKNLSMIGHVESLFLQLQPACGRAEAELAARALWSSIHGVCILSLTGKLDSLDAKDIEKIIDSLVASYLDGWQQSFS